MLTYRIFEDFDDIQFFGGDSEQIASIHGHVKVISGALLAEPVERFSPKRHDFLGKHAHLSAAHQSEDFVVQK